MPIFKYPDEGPEVVGKIKLKKVLHRDTKIRYSIEGYKDLWIQFDTSTGKALLARTVRLNRFAIMKDNIKVNLEEELDNLDEDLRDFILFNLDLFR